MALFLSCQCGIEYYHNSSVPSKIDPSAKALPMDLLPSTRSVPKRIYCLQNADEGIQLFQRASVPDHHLHEMNIYAICMDSGFFQLARFLHICILGNILPACALPISNKHRGAGRRNVWGMVATTYW